MTSESPLFWHGEIPGVTFFFARLLSEIVSTVIPAGRVETLPIMRNSPSTIEQRSHLQEICVVLGLDLVRLRRHTIEDIAGNPAQGRDIGENCLHISSKPGGHAPPNKRTFP